MGLGFGSGLGLGLWRWAVSHKEMQQALRWWMQQEVIDRATYADRVQNELIQDLFALRLRLQSASSPPSESLAQLPWLAEAEQLHALLNHLSTAFLSPYLPDGLTLAIRALFQQWQAHNPGQGLQIDLPIDWAPEPLEQSYLILALLQRLLQLTSASVSPVLVKVRLIQQNSQAQLSIQLIYAETPAPLLATQAQTLKYLRRCFQCLMPGWCRHQVQAQEMSWQFGWNKWSQPKNNLTAGGLIDETD